MQNSLISGDDMRYLVQQTPEALTTIMGQMTSLVQGITDLQNDTNERVEAMEKQPWYKKMWMTITGKNKASKAEIQRNQDKIISYISEAVAQLYQMNCIDQQVMCSLGNRMNQVYAQVTEVYNEQLQMKAQMAEIMAVQQQTIQALGGFVTKLNEKIESVDNFHMLITEIQQGHYHDESQLYSLCCVLAQLDKRTLEDDRKLNILRDALTQSEIISEDSISIQQYLMDILTLADNKVGVVYLELCNFRNSFPANLFAEMIETYHFLLKMEKMSKSKDILIQELLSKYKLDASAKFSFSDVSENFLENKENNLVNADVLQITMKNNIDDAKLKQAETAFFQAKFKDAIPLFEELANQGNGRAMYFIGEIYIHGYGVTKDKPKGEYWRQKGAEAGDPLAKLNTAYSYEKNSIERETIINEVFSAVLQLAESGDPVAQNEIEDLMQDEAKSIEWLNKSAAQGYFRSENKLAFYYYKNKDYAQAIIWFRKLAEKGIAPAQNILGDCFFDGKGIPRNYSKAEKWYKKAAEQGHIIAQFNLGYYYINIMENYDEGVRWFKKAAEQGDRDSQCQLGYYYSRIAEDYDEAVKWFKRAAEQGDADAMFELSDVYFSMENYAETVMWLKKAAEHGNTDAMVALGNMYLEGELLEKDSVNALKWLEKAAEHDNTDAMFMLGLFCTFGENGIKEDVDNGIKWLKKAIEKKDPRSMKIFGDCYYDGQGVPQNYNEAVKWYKKAAEQGHFYAMKALSRCYEDGTGVTRNREEAEKWLKKAVENGYVED